MTAWARRRVRAVALALAAPLGAAAKQVAAGGLLQPGALRRGRIFAGASGSSFGVGNGGTGYWRRYAGFAINGWF